MKVTLVPALLVLTLAACAPSDSDPSPSPRPTASAGRHEVAMPEWGVRTTVRDGLTSRPFGEVTSGTECWTGPTATERSSQRVETYGMDRGDHVFETSVYVVPEGCFPRTGIGHETPYLATPESASRPGTRRGYRITGAKVVEVQHEDQFCTNGCRSVDVWYSFVTWDSPAAGRPRTIVLRTDRQRESLDEMRAQVADLRQG